MDHLLIAREGVIKTYKNYEPFILPVLRFLLGWYVFSKINGIGYAMPELNEYLSAVPLSLLLAVAFVFLPLALSYFLMIANIAAQYSANTEIAAIVFLFLLCILLFYARMAAKESIMILLTVLAFYFKLPYLIPLLAGMYSSLTVIVPVAIGVFIASYMPVINSLVQTSQTAGLNVTEMPDTFMNVYTAMVNGLTSTQDWIFTAFIFAMVIILVHVVSKLAIDFAKEIAIGLGCALLVFGFIMALLVADDSAIKLFPMIMLTILCGLLAEFVRMFDPLLDYQRAESVQFEDESNYYFVRIVPKIRLTPSKRVVRRIRPQPEDDD